MSLVSSGGYCAAAGFVNATAPPTSPSASAAAQKMRVTNDPLVVLRTSAISFQKGVCGPPPIVPGGGPRQRSAVEVFRTQDLHPQDLLHHVLVDIGQQSL